MQMMSCLCTKYTVPLLSLNARAEAVEITVQCIIIILHRTMFSKFLMFLYKCATISASCKVFMQLVPYTVSQKTAQL